MAFAGETNRLSLWLRRFDLDADPDDRAENVDMFLVDREVLLQSSWVMSSSSRIWIFLTELGLRNGVSRHFRPFTSLLRLPARK
jgi:hypothetical protein